MTVKPSFLSTGLDRATLDQEMATTLGDKATFSLIDELSTFPGVANAIYAVSASGVNPQFRSVLDDYMTSGGRINGNRSKQVPKDPSKVTAPLTEGQEFVIRPNGVKYYIRPWGIHDDVSVVKQALANKKYVLALGDPGTGKTAMFEAAFPQLVTIVGTNDTEVSDFVGGYVPTDKPGEFLWVDGPLIRAMEAGEILNIDEILLIDTKVLSVVYPLMDGRDELVVTANPSRGIVKAAPGFGIVGSGNPNAPGARMSEALASRFSIHVEVTTSFELAKTLGIGDLVIVAAQNLAHNRKTNLVSWSPQFRELEDFEALSKLFGQEFAIQNLIATAPELDRPRVSEVMREVFAIDLKAATV
jgi:hypothetical protein